VSIPFKGTILDISKYRLPWVGFAAGCLIGLITNASWAVPFIGIYGFVLMLIVFWELKLFKKSFSGNVDPKIIQLLSFFVSYNFLKKRLSYYEFIFLPPPDEYNQRYCLWSSPLFCIFIIFLVPNSYALFSIISFELFESTYLVWAEWVSSSIKKISGLIPAYSKYLEEGAELGGINTGKLISNIYIFSYCVGLICIGLTFISPVIHFYQIRESTEHLVFNYGGWKKTVGEAFFAVVVMLALFVIFSTVPVFIGGGTGGSSLVSSNSNLVNIFAVSSVVPLIVYIFYIVVYSLFILLMNKKFYMY
jgi:hypothetical protein